MDQITKQALSIELNALKAMISGSTACANMLTQATYTVTTAMGPGSVNIHSLPGAAQAFQQQADCMQKLATLLEKVINTA